MSKNILETEGPQMTSHYGPYALHAGLARLYARMGTLARVPTSTHARSSMHTHTECVTLTAFL